MQTYLKTYEIHPIIFSCLQYDASYLMAYGLDFAVRRGIEYEIPEKLNSVFRDTRFTGCSGYCSFEASSNNRSF